MNQHLPGVYETKKKNGSSSYRSSITYKNKHISLGSYPTAQAASHAYLAAQELLSTPTISLEDYPSDHPLPFEKWVVLANFRDNGIYFANPIYLRKKYFQYLLNPQITLLFDLDDLFYYSSHKIMKRGGHYFVADYGMQVNIFNRYGIKNYAVEGKDYRFINGDSFDFRYENIEIMNSYHGVHAQKTANGPRFSSKIHLNGNYTIGTYDTDIEAAIAYNKSIDILKKNGVNRNFTPNYLENLSPSAYADIYSKIKISAKIKNYRLE